MEPIIILVIEGRYFRCRHHESHEHVRSGDRVMFFTEEKTSEMKVETTKAFAKQ